MEIIKTAKEIKLLEKSAKIADSCIPIIEAALREKNITEKEIARRIRKKIYSQNAKLAFRTLVACDVRSAMIHAKPAATDKIISGLGYVDFGASYKGYRSDVTVPFVKGKISKRQRKIVNTALRAYDIAISSIKIGEPCWKLFQKINNFLRKNGFEFKHSLGHGIGLKTHEYLTIVMPRKKKLKKKIKRRWERLKKINFQKGMVFTIEPGIYAKGIGGCRIENDVLLTKNGQKVLTRARLIKI